MVQCAIPVFDGLFPDEHNASIRILLFRLAEWHALAKLRLHSEDSFKLLELSLKQLTTQLRRFVKVTCAAFETKELPVEAAARWRREKTQVKNLPNGPRPKSFNLLTYKFHALGDYVQTIRLFGTTDSYTTQIVSTIHTKIPSSSSSIPSDQGELSHRLIKKLYGSTNKQHVSRALAKQHRCFTHVQWQTQLVDPPEFEVSDMDLIAHHILTGRPGNVVNLRKFLYDLCAKDDPAIKVSKSLKIIR